MALKLTDLPVQPEHIAYAAELVSQTLGMLRAHVVPGKKTMELDDLAYQFIMDHAGATPGFKNYEGFPGTLCISVNEEAVHGKPSDYVLQEGDIVTLDCGVLYKGHFGDAAYTFPVGKISKELVNLLSCAKEALYKGIAEIGSGKRIGDIGSAVETYLKGNNLGIVREYGGHGIGRVLHGEPHIKNFGKRGTGKRMKKGDCYCIEPIVTLGSSQVITDDRGRIVTKDGSPVAHFEHMVHVTDKGPELLSSFGYINPEEK